MTAAPPVSRRGLLGAVGGATLAVGAGAGAGWAAMRSGDAEAAVAAGTPVPFHGTHQAGIATAVQDRLHMAAFDLTSDSRQSWSTCCAAGPRPRSG